MMYYAVKCMKKHEIIKLEQVDHINNEYNQCSLRISSRTDGKGDCKGQFEELCQCQDHCVGHEIFHHVK